MINDELSNNAPEDIEELTTGSPCRKRAKVDDLNVPTSQSSDNPVCPICLDSWSSTGTHRLVSLKCGHLFGQICIEKWLSGGSGKCPQCNGPARKSDIRPIYAKVVCAVDTSERDSAVRLYEAEKLKRNRLEQLHLKTSMQCQLFTSENILMRKRINELENKIKILESQHVSVGNTPSSHGRYSFLRNVFVSHEKKAQVFSSDPFTGIMAISKKFEDCGNKYGVLKVSSIDACHHEFVAIHQNQIRDISFSPMGNTTLLSCSKDKELKLTCLKSNSVILSYPTNRDAWSCSWSSTQHHQMYCGIQNGEVFVYDIRNTHRNVDKIIPVRVNQRCPVISIHSISASSDSQKEGILVSTLQGITYYSKNTKHEFEGNHLDIPTGALSSVSYEAESSHILASYKPGVKNPNERHVLLKLDKFCNSSIVHTFKGGPIQHLRSRTSLIKCPDDDNELLICAGNQSDSSVSVWSTKDMNLLQKWNIRKEAGAIIYTGPHRSSGSDYLCVLTNQSVNQYKWLLSKSHFNNHVLLD